MTIVSVITEANGRYCEESLNPAFSHVWVMTMNVLHCGPGALANSRICFVR